ncbi:MAG: response regulator, partial [Chromatiales bacterium]|nr:response regulator [Chromatiales bacterium]
VALQIDEQIEGTMKMLGRLIGENIELEFAKSEETWETRLDPSQFDQILVNLAVNARDAMPSGGKLVITTKNVVINEEQAKKKGDCIPGDYVLMSVRDDGIGMSLDTQERIFEPFFTTKEAGKGTGLGLPTIFGIMKQNHGCIDLESEPGKGTCFKLYFPRNTTPGDQPETRQEDEAGKGVGTVLLVEDDEMVRGMATKMLEKIGYTVVAVASPMQAIAYCESGLHAVDLLLTDVVMPKMSGIELSQRLKDTYPELKVLFMSGYAALVSDRHGVIQPGLNFIQKPFSKSDLALKISQVIGDVVAEAD